MGEPDMEIEFRYWWKKQGQTIGKRIAHHAWMFQQKRIDKLNEILTKRIQKNEQELPR